MCALVAAAQVGTATASDAAVGVTVGTTGLGADLDFSLGSRLGARVGYSGFVYHHDISQTDVTYAGKLTFSEFSGLLDWYALGGGFRLTAGAFGGNTRVDVNGRPTAGTYRIGNATYTAAEVGTLSGQLKFGNSVSPYVGIGWGNPFLRDDRVTLQVDVGAIYGGTPSVSLAAHCGTAAPPGSPVCDQIQSQVPAERRKLQDDVTVAKWYPVVNVGVAIRF
jgi:hypothetical protein